MHLPALRLPHIPLRPRRLRRLSFSRFSLMYLLLAAAIGGTVVGVVLVYTGSGTSTATATATAGGWSAWQPARRNRVTTLVSIAQHVSPQYRLANGHQLTAVIPKVATVTTTDAEFPISALVIHTGFPLDSPKDLSVGLVGRGAMYIMRGTASGGGLPGAPSVARGELVRREAI
jgi:hypothetical protein